MISNKALKAYEYIKINKLLTDEQFDVYEEIIYYLYSYNFPCTIIDITECLKDNNYDIGEIFSELLLLEVIKEDGLVKHGDSPKVLMSYVVTENKILKKMKFKKRITNVKLLDDFEDASNDPINVSLTEELRSEILLRMTGE